MKVSAIGSTPLFVDLDQENASVWSPSTETNLENTDPPWRAAARQTRVAQLTPGAAPHQPRARTRRNEISRSGGHTPSLRYAWVPGLRGLWGSGAGGSQDICVCSPRHGARGEHAMASAEHKMAFAEHARKGGAGLRFFLRSTETYRPRRKNIMNSIFT